MRLIRLLKNDIAKEAAEWVDENIISTSQAEGICQKYGVDYHQQNSHSFGYLVLITLGYLFIGLALITLIGANWDNIPRAVRMAGLIAITMMTHGIALKKYSSVDASSDKYSDKSSANGFFFLGNLFFGASIILIAQIYHLGEHMPDGVFWWALGTLPIGVLTKNTWLTLFSLALSILWFFMEMKYGFYGYLFPIFILASAWVLIQGKQNIFFFLTVVFSIFIWVEYTFNQFWKSDTYSHYSHINIYPEHIAIAAGLFIFAYVCGHWLNRQTSVKAKDYGAILALWCLRFGLILLLILSFDSIWRELIKEDWEHTTSLSIFVGLISVASLVLAFFTKKLNPVIYIICFHILTLAAVLLTDNSKHALYFQITYNIVLVIAGIWLIVKGIHEGMTHYFFLGVVTILITALVRYFDLVGGYIGGALLFMLFAIILLGAAKYWKNYQFKAIPV